MRNLLALAAFCVITFATVGYFQGWYQVKTNLSSDGNRNLNIDFNTKKISTDVDKGRDFLQEKLKTIEENDKKTAKVD